MNKKEILFTFLEFFAIQFIAYPIIAFFSNKTGNPYVFCIISAFISALLITIYLTMRKTFNRNISMGAILGIALLWIVFINLLEC